MKKAIMLLVVSSLTGCTSTRLRVVDLDANSGYFPGAARQATVVESKAVDLDTKKQLILFPGHDFTSGMLAKIGYFDEVMTLSDLETHIVTENLGDKVQNVNTRIGISNAAKHYKPFLWLHYKTSTASRLLM